jgi:IS5 family transposase
MLTYSKLAKRPSQFRSFTGLEPEEFDSLYETIESQHGEYEVKRLDRKVRIRAIGGGRKFKLVLKDRVLMLLVYYRLYITYTLEGFLFDLDQGNVCRNIKYLEPLVKRCIPLPEKVHRRAKKIGTMEELLEYFPELKAIPDATEQEIPRPKNKRRRKSHYSGKKKRHTVKTQLIVNRKGLIVHKTRHSRGKKHDYQLYKDTRPFIPPDVEVEADSGYQGIERDFPGLRARIPRKKPRGKGQSGKNRRYNRKLSRERVVVEHVIGRAKKFGIMGGRFRNRLRRYDSMTSIVCGLINLRVMLREGMELDRFVG